MLEGGGEIKEYYVHGGSGKLILQDIRFEMREAERSFKIRQYAVFCYSASPWHTRFYYCLSVRVAPLGVEISGAGCYTRFQVFWHLTPCRFG